MVLRVGDRAPAVQRNWPKHTVVSSLACRREVGVRTGRWDVGSSSGCKSPCILYSVSFSGLEFTLFPLGTQQAAFPPQELTGSQRNDRPLRLLVAWLAPGWLVSGNLPLPDRWGQGRPMCSAGGGEQGAFDQHPQARMPALESDSPPSNSSHLPFATV